MFKKLYLFLYKKLRPEHYCIKYGHGQSSRIVRCLSCMDDIIPGVVGKKLKARQSYCPVCKKSLSLNEIAVEEYFHKIALPDHLWQLMIKQGYLMENRHTTKYFQNTKPSERSEP